MNSDPFTVHSGWELQWTTTGKQLQVGVSGARDLGVVIKRTGSGGGSTYPIGSGSFRLSVTAQGPWTITVVDHRSS